MKHLGEFNRTSDLDDVALAEEFNHPSQVLALWICPKENLAARGYGTGASGGGDHSNVTAADRDAI